MTTTISPTPVKLDKDDRNALEKVKRWLLRVPGQKKVNTSVAIRAAIHMAAEKVENEQKAS